MKIEQDKRLRMGGTALLLLAGLLIWLHYSTRKSDPMPVGMQGTRSEPTQAVALPPISPEEPQPSLLPAAVVPSVDQVSAAPIPVAKPIVRAIPVGIPKSHPPTSVAKTPPTQVREKILPPVDDFMTALGAVDDDSLTQNWDGTEGPSLEARELHSALAQSRKEISNASH